VNLNSTLGPVAAAQPSIPRINRLRGLGTWFTLFSAARVLAYLPTIWAVQRSGDSSQHSLWTWLIWVGANVTMAAWMYEVNGQRVDRVTVLAMANAVLCTLTTAVIAWHRF
jgi:hypothetical protein